MQENRILGTHTLAEIESVTPQAIGTALSALEQRGLVARAQDPNDGRKVISTITEAGRATLASREQAVNQHMARALRDGFDAAERRQIAAVIPLLEDSPTSSNHARARMAAGELYYETAGRVSP